MTNNQNCKPNEIVKDFFETLEKSRKQNHEHEIELIRKISNLNILEENSNDKLLFIAIAQEALQIEYLDVKSILKDRFFLYNDFLLNLNNKQKNILVEKIFELKNINNKQNDPTDIESFFLNEPEEYMIESKGYQPTSY